MLPAFLLFFFIMHRRRQDGCNSWSLKSQ